LFFSQPALTDPPPPPRSTAQASDATRQGSGDHPKLNSVTAGMADGKLSFRHDPLRQR
jgi:hypothetical protein